MSLFLRVENPHEKGQKSEGQKLTTKKIIFGVGWEKSRFSPCHLATSLPLEKIELTFLNGRDWGYIHGVNIEKNEVS